MVVVVAAVGFSSIQIIIMTHKTWELIYLNDVGYMKTIMLCAGKGMSSCVWALCTHEIFK